MPAYMDNVNMGAYGALLDRQNHNASLASQDAQKGLTLEQVLASQQKRKFDEQMQPGELEKLMLANQTTSAALPGVGAQSDSLITKAATDQRDLQVRQQSSIQDEHKAVLEERQTKILENMGKRKDAIYQLAAYANTVGANPSLPGYLAQELKRFGFPPQMADGIGRLSPEKALAAIGKFSEASAKITEKNLQELDAARTKRTQALADDKRDRSRKVADDETAHRRSLNKTSHQLALEFGYGVQMKAFETMLNKDLERVKAGAKPKESLLDTIPKLEAYHLAVVSSDGTTREDKIKSQRVLDNIALYSGTKSAAETRIGERPGKDGSPEIYYGAPLGSTVDAMGLKPGSSPGDERKSQFKVLRQGSK
jgi:hypothetical protein